MIIQFLLTIGLLGCLAYGLVQRERTSVVTIAIFAVSLGGIVLVWTPSLAAYLAQAVGVGRGSDLIFYLWIVISLAILINLHTKLYGQLRLITGLVRKIAILEERLQESKESERGS